MSQQEYYETVQRGEEYERDRKATQKNRSSKKQPSQHEPKKIGEKRLRKIYLFRIAGFYASRDFDF